MKRIGLTGSIAMGKSETLKMFARLGCAVFDADSAVHELYALGGAAVPAVEKLFPEAIKNGSVDREILSRYVLGNSAALQDLEKIIHPLVRQAQAAFIAKHDRKGTAIVVLDIPLLYETQRQTEFDYVVLASTTAQIQHDRAMKRPGMTEEKLRNILSRQLPDDQKRNLADFIVDTGQGLDAAFEQVRKIVETVSSDSCILKRT